MSPRAFSIFRRLSIVLLLTCFLLTEKAGADVRLVIGDFVRVTRSETLLFQGKNFLGAPKGQDFLLLQNDFGRHLAYVAYTKEDGTVIAVALPADAVEPSPPDGWLDLVRGVEAFRDQRYDEAKRLIALASQDAKQKQLTLAIGARVNGALASFAQARGGSGRPVFLTMLQSLRDTAPSLVQLGDLCLALPLDEGADKLAVAVGGEGLAASKIDRADLAKRVAISNRAVARARQSIAIHRLAEASKMIEEGLAAEPGRFELKSWQAQVQKDVAEADERYKNADSMRRFNKGEVHALTAIELGLKVCADHPKLIALKKELSGAFEERTSPPVTPAFLTVAKVSTPSAALEEGHKLYTTRCTECHDLELLDSRGLAGWQKAVAGMSRRANLNDKEQTRILDYIAAAQKVVEAQ